MLFCLIAIKFYQFTQMVTEAFKMGSLKIYAKELAHELSFELQDIKVVETVAGGVNQLRVMAKVGKDKVAEKMVPVIMYVSPLAPKLAIIVKVLHESIKETTAQSRDVVKT